MTVANRRSVVACALAACLAMVLGTVVPAEGRSVDRYQVVAPICGVAQPDHARCLAWRRIEVAAGTPGARPLTLARPGYATGPVGGLTPADIATAYRVNANTATSQVVAIVDAFDNPNALSDLNVFDKQYGLPAETATSFRKVSQLGSSTALPVANVDWGGEEALDLDAVRGLCHKCRILLVEANSDSDTDLALAENEAVSLGATVISNSFGEPENGPIPSAMTSSFKHAGVVVLAGTGDDGMYSWDITNGGGGSSSNAPMFPASLNSVVAVGGTTLTLNSDGTRQDETVWNENGEDNLVGGTAGFPVGATGGGCSAQVAAQLWQQGTAGWSATTCGSKRLPADVAALADPYTGYDIYNTYQSSGWQTVGGTSLATPLVAAMWAMAGGAGGVSYPALSLYGHLKSDSVKPFFDVTSGGSGFCGGDTPANCESYWGQSPNTLGVGTLDCAWLPNSETLAAGTRACDAATGFDGPSGVGVPTGLAGFKAMNPIARITLPTSLVHGSSAAFSAVKSTDPFPNGSWRSFAWTWGDGTTSTLTTAAAAHTYQSAGSYTVKLTVTDRYGRSNTAATTVSAR